MEVDSGKWSSSGFILLDCPQSMKIESSTASLVGSISDYFLSLSNGWDLTSFLKSLSKVLKALNLDSCFASNPKEGSTGPCMVSSMFTFMYLLVEISYFSVNLCYGTLHIFLFTVHIT